MRHRLHILSLGFAAFFLTLPGLSEAQSAQRTLDPSRKVTQYPIQSWTLDDGLPQLSITSIAQDHDGYLWLGTQEGLVRFDGLVFKVYDRSNSIIPKNTVSDIAVDENGIVWVGTEEGGVVRFSGDRKIVLGERHGLAENNVTVVTSTGKGEIWVGTNSRGVSVYSGGRFQNYDTEDGLPGNEVNVIYQDRSSNIWIGTREGIVRFDGDGFVPLDLVEALPDDNITAIYQDTDDVLWIGTDNGLSSIHGPAVVTYSSADGLPDNSISSILEDDAGNMWIGTVLGGVSRFNGASFETLSEETGLAHNEVNEMFVDREKNLWVGTDGGGLSRLSNGKFISYTEKEGFASKIAYSIFQDSKRAIWIGSEGGGVSRLKDGEFTTFSRREGLPGQHVFAIAETSDGSMWFGTRDGGLARYLNGSFEIFTTDNGLPSNSVYALYTDSNDVLWIAGEEGGAVQYKDGQFTTFGVEDGLASTYAQVFLEDRQRNMWVGTYDNGLTLLRDGQVLLHLSEEDGLESEQILSLHEDSDGVLWIGTGSGGLHRYKDGHLVNIDTQDGLFNDTILEILEDYQGSLWMSSNKGIFTVSKKQLNDFSDGKLGAVTSTVFGRTDGLPSSEFNGGFQPAGQRTQDGKLWFPSTNGVVSIDPSRIVINDVPPIVIIEEVRADGEVQEGSGQLEILPGTNRFEFGYAATTMTAPSKVSYQYMLSGVDTQWINAENRREATYTNLAPGNYEFHVRAINGDGIQSTSDAVVAFHLRPFFYQTSWFYILCGASLLMLSLLIYLVRVQHLTTRQKELERTVDERTADLRQEKERTESALTAAQDARRDAEEQATIARQAKQVIEAQADKLLEMDRIRSRFFSNLSHEFRTPLTLTIGPLENALSGVYGPVSNRLAKQLEVMLRNSRRLLRLINQLLDLSKLESGNLRLRLSEGNIMHLVEGVVLSFTPFAENEGIKIHLENRSKDPTLFFDRESIEKILFNLLSNAVKFTPEKGQIDVIIEDRQAIIRGADFEVVRIRVKDSGVGIPADQIKHIFDRFHQVDGTVSRVQEGTGIGLSLVKELVDLHGGSINVTSNVGDGAEFAITLPKGREHLEGHDFTSDDDEEFDSAFEITHGPMVEMAVFDRDDDVAGDFEDVVETDEAAAEVLIVDDNRDIRDYVVSCLEKAYKIRTATDGVDAIRKIKERLPDLIISDVMMPNMDGYELCRTLKTDADYKHIPIILLTSKASTESKIEGLKSGSDDFIAKPFNAKELRLRVSNLLSIHTQARELRTLNNNLLDANEALIEASDLKTQLLNIASHDMKNPLTAIREFSRIIKEEVDKESHLNELLDLIYSSSNEMLHLVTQLLDSAGLESGGLVLNKRPCDIGALASIVVHRNKNQADLKDQTIKFETPPEEEFMIVADADRLHEAMDNLLSNAIKYSPLSKTIWVDISRENGFVKFEVRDEGPGLTLDDKSKVFGKFQKLSAQPTGGESSTGLGLSIVKQIIELHDGTVWAESEPDVGSRFAFTIPAHTMLPPTNGKKAPSFPANRSRANL